MYVGIPIYKYIYKYIHTTGMTSRALCCVSALARKINALRRAEQSRVGDEDKGEDRTISKAVLPF